MAAVQEQGGVVAELRRQLDRLVAGVDAQAVTQAMLDGSADRDLYVGFLVQSRHYVALTEPCLTAAGQRLRELGRHPHLADLFFQKAEEETGHDILIDRDLRALGLDPEATLSSEGPKGWVTAYNSWIRAATAGDHPIAFLGSAYLLEGLAIHRAGRIARALTEAGRIPAIEKAVTFLDLHAEADIGHVDDMDRLLDAFDDPVECDAITMTAATTRGAYLGMLEDVGQGWRKAA